MTHEESELTLLDIGKEWDGRWDTLVGSTVESGLMQSSAWAAYFNLMN